MQSFVGNDLVDLSVREHQGKSDDVRYMERTLDPSELAQLELHEAGEERDRYFWSLWAAKEAAYKVVKKSDPDVYFSPNRFVVDRKSGVVKFKNFICPVIWEYGRDWIHCISVNSISLLKNGNLSWEMQSKSEITYRPDEFLPYEKLSIYSEESGQVRQMVKNFLAKKGYAKYQIVRRPMGTKFAPPELWYNGKKMGSWDISMSHDGNYIAACLLKGEDIQIH